MILNRLPSRLPPCTHIAHSRRPAAGAATGVLCAGRGPQDGPPPVVAWLRGHKLAVMPHKGTGPRVMPPQAQHPAPGMVRDARRPCTSSPADRAQPPPLGLVAHQRTRPCNVCAPIRRRMFMATAFLSLPSRVRLQRLGADRLRGSTSGSRRQPSHRRSTHRAQVPATGIGSALPRVDAQLCHFGVVVLQDDLSGRRIANLERPDGWIPAINRGVFFAMRWIVFYDPWVHRCRYSRR